MPDAHSTIVGGSSAKRVINCPGSVRLCQEAPPKPSSAAADEGTLCHAAIEAVMEDRFPDPRDVIGMRLDGGTVELTEELYRDLILPALAALDVIDPDGEMEYVAEQQVSYGNVIPGAFGTTDILGRLKSRAIVLDWKFGAYAVQAEENEQGLYYAGAAMRTPGLEWVFNGATELEIIIVQPRLPNPISRWVTMLDRVRQFEKDLVAAIKLSELPPGEAPLKDGPWCRWCAGKTACPLMTGALERALNASLEKVDAVQLADFMAKADLAEAWIKSVRELAFTMLDKGKPIPGYKLVAKRAARKWKNEALAVSSISSLGLLPIDMYDTTIKSPAQMEKVLKEKKLELPADLVSAVSSGNTVVAESDPRPPVNLLSGQLTAALSKLG